jgi:hypothetical protein
MDPTAIPIEADLTLLRTQLAAFQRRRDRRYRCSLATSGKLHFAATGEVMVAWIYNLSAGGIGLELPEPLLVGQEMILQMKTTGGDQSHRLAARVMHSTPCANGCWRIGCRFEHKLDRDVLESLL